MRAAIWYVNFNSRFIRIYVCTRFCFFALFIGLRRYLLCMPLAGWCAPRCGLLGVSMPSRSVVCLCLVCGVGFLAGPFLGRLSFRYSAQSQVLRAKRRKTCLRRLADRWVYCCTYYMPTRYARGGCIDSRPLKKLLALLTSAIAVSKPHHHHYLFA